MTFDSRREQFQWRVDHHVSTVDLFQRFSGLTNNKRFADRLCSTVNIYEETAGLATRIVNLNIYALTNIFSSHILIMYRYGLAH